MPRLAHAIARYEHGLWRDEESRRDLGGRQALREAVKLQALIKPHLFPMVKALGLMRRTDPAAEAAWQERDRARLSRCRDLAMRLNREGELQEGVSVDHASALIWAATSYAVWEDLVESLGWSARRYVSHVTRLLEHGLLA